MLPELSAGTDYTAKSTEVFRQVAKLAVLVPLPTSTVQVLHISSLRNLEQMINTVL